MIIPSPRFSLTCWFIIILLRDADVSADTSLFIPGFDEQPLSVSELGAGADGRTTWQLVSGQQTGTLEDSFPATATLIEGPSDAVLLLSLSDSYMSASCAIGADGTADCNYVVVDPTATSTDTDVETVSPFLVQGGATPPSTTPGPVSTTSGTTTAATPSGTGSANNNSAERVGWDLAVGAIIGFVGLVLA